MISSTGSGRSAGGVPVARATSAAPARAAPAQRVPLLARGRSLAQRGERLAVGARPAPRARCRRWSSSVPLLSGRLGVEERRQPVQLGVHGRPLTSPSVPGARAAETRTARRRPSTVVRRHVPTLRQPGDHRAPANRSAPGGCGCPAAEREVQPRIAQRQLVVERQQPDDLAGRAPVRRPGSAGSHHSSSSPIVADSSRSAARPAAARAGGQGQRRPARRSPARWSVRVRRRTAATARPAGRRAVLVGPTGRRSASSAYVCCGAAQRTADDQPVQLGRASPGRLSRMPAGAATPAAASRSPMLGPGQTPAALEHRRPAGPPCASVVAASTPSRRYMPALVWCTRSAVAARIQPMSSGATSARSGGGCGSAGGRRRRTRRRSRVGRSGGPQPAATRPRGPTPATARR